MKKGRLKMTWKMQVEEESIKVGLRREDAIWPPSLVGDTTRF